MIRYYYMYKGLKCKKVVKYWKVFKIYIIGIFVDGEGGFYIMGCFVNKLDVD